MKHKPSQSHWRDLPESARAFTARHTGHLAESLLKYAGKELVSEWRSRAAGVLAQDVFYSDFVLLSHGTELDPVLNYGNFSALELWGMPWKEFTRMPSRLTAEPDQWEDRAELLRAVERDGHACAQRESRITAAGTRFQIKEITIWRVDGPQGERAGIAAMFDDWEFLK